MSQWLNRKVLKPLSRLHLLEQDTRYDPTPTRTVTWRSPYISNPKYQPEPGLNPLKGYMPIKDMARLYSRYEWPTADKLLQDQRDGILYFTPADYADRLTDNFTPVYEPHLIVSQHRLPERLVKQLKCRQKLAVKASIGSAVSAFSGVWGSALSQMPKATMANLPTMGVIASGTAILGSAAAALASVIGYEMAGSGVRTTERLALKPLKTLAVLLDKTIKK